MNRSSLLLMSALLLGACATVEPGREEADKRRQPDLPHDDAEDESRTDRKHFKGHSDYPRSKSACAG